MCVCVWGSTLARRKVWAQLPLMHRFSAQSFTSMRAVQKTWALSRSQEHLRAKRNNIFSAAGCELALGVTWRLVQNKCTYVRECVCWGASIQQTLCIRVCSFKLVLYCIVRVIVVCVHCLLIGRCRRVCHCMGSFGGLECSLKESFWMFGGLECCLKESF